MDKFKKKKISNGLKIGILSLFLIFSFINKTYAEDKITYECRTTCQVTDSNDGYWRQADQNKCIGRDADGNSVVGCEENTDYKNQCCEKIDELEFKKTYGNYDMKDILTTAIKLSNQLLGIVGSIALLFFIIAGIRMMLSGGSEEKIKNAKTMMVQTIVGLIIFLSAYLIVSFVQKTLLDTSEDSKNYQLETKNPDYQVKEEDEN